MYDVMIIGAGITGSLIAKELSHYQLQVAILEKDNDVANEATAANSAIIHSGHDPKDGTLKAKLNVRGNQLFEALCKELQVDFMRCGGLVVAVTEEELAQLDLLYQQAVDRHIPVRYVTKEEAQAMEPNLSDQVIKAIDLPSTGIVCPWEVAIAAVEDAMNNGVELYLEHPVKNIKQCDSYFEITTPKRTFQTKTIINCAGVYADDIYRMVSKQVSFTIHPRKGEYYVLDKEVHPIVSRVIYPLPSEKGKGVLVVPTTHNNVLLGPNSEVIEDKEGNNNTVDALRYVRQEVSKTVKNIPMNQIIRTFVGLRPTGSTHDFIIEEAKDVPNFINVACIESPGLASAPAISEYVVKEILLKKRDLALKTAPRIQRRPWVVLKKMDFERRQSMVKQDPRYAQMICRCEQISEGEIVDAIHRNCGATTVKGVKKRVRPGTGRCQGGFCEPKVVDILARELHKSPLEILMDSSQSTMLVASTKE